MRQAYIVVGLGYGDEGKGSITDFLVHDKNASLVVRYNGGAQAAHNVVLPDGRHHTFSQWGSGSFHGARTFLSKHMVVHPLALIREAEHLTSVGVRDPFGLLVADGRCRVITPYQACMNRIREICRGPNRHGSCGVGVGETVEDADKDFALRLGDLTDRPLLRKKLEMARDAKLAIIENMDLPQEAEWESVLMKDILLIDRLVELYPAIAKRFVILDPERSDRWLRTANTVVFEGAQGVMIDQDWGFHPHTTWSNCTDFNAREMLKGQDFKVQRIGVLRAYATRHGPGPFVPYDAKLTEELKDIQNTFHQWQREFRCGWFDVPAARYAIEANEGIDYLAITNLDRTWRSEMWGACLSYQKKDGTPYSLVPPLKPTPEKMREIGDQLMECTPEVVRTLADRRPVDISAIDNIQALLGHKAGLTSRGETYEHKKWEI